MLGTAAVWVLGHATRAARVSRALERLRER
jgi:hypothetical protein